MKNIMTSIAIVAALAASNIYAAKDYVIQVTEKDGTVREIPVSNLEKITFETATTTIEVDDPYKAMDERFGTEKISATQYKVPSKVAEKMVKEYHAKSAQYNNKI